MATLPHALRTESAILDRLHQGRGVVLSAIRRTLTKAVRGTVAVEEAIGAVRRYLDPRSSTRVLAGAPSLSRTPERIMGLLPGGASHQARRILSTETTRAHAEGRVRLARERGYLLKWETSPLHRLADACTEHATRDVGFGAGLYRADDAPTPPEHPLCRCFLAVIRPSAEQMARLLAFSPGGVA